MQVGWSGTVLGRQVRIVFLSDVEVRVEALAGARWIMATPEEASAALEAALIESLRDESA